MNPMLACLLIGFPLLAQAHGPDPHSPAPERVILEPERLALPNLPVTDRFGVQTGLRDALSDGRPVILSFTYTACDTLCGIANALLTVVDADLGAGAEREAVIVTVAIDPVRDTPQAMAREADRLGAGPGWLWLTGGPRGTRPILEALRFPPGAIEDHDPMFLVGRPCLGRFTRIVGLVDPATLADLARAQPPCGG